MATTPLQHLLAPITIGPREVKNRIMLCPMERNYAHRDGRPSAQARDHYAAIASGGVGWIDVEATYVDPVGKARTHQVGLHDDICIPGFREITDAVHAHGALIGVELVHGGRNTSTAVSGYQVVGPSPIPCMEAGGDMPHELTVPEIQAIVGRFADAARRAEQAGFDAVELHAAHGYLPCAFLSPRSNRRSDEYGGTLERRMRFTLEVIDAMREAVSDRMVVGCRFIADELVPGGIGLDDAIAYGQALERHGVHYLSISVGVYETAGLIVAPMAIPHGWILPRAAAIKQAVGIPVLCAGRFVDPRMADQAIADGQIDMVAMGRALLTDPELPNKLATGREDEIVHCIGCNQGCSGRLETQLDVTCLINPAVGREATFTLRPADKARDVVVVGGGPAGMEAARVAAERGHTVTLYERERELGGLATLSGAAPDRVEWTVMVRDAVRRLERSGAEVRLGAEPTVDDLRRADAVVLATGARFTLPKIAGAPDGLVTDPTQLLRDGVEGIARAVVVKDPGRHIGLTVASALLAAGAEVHIVTTEPTLSDPVGDAGVVDRLRATGRLREHCDKVVSRVLDDGAIVVAQTNTIAGMYEESIPAPDIVVACDDRRARSEMAFALLAAAPQLEVHEVGDCDVPRTVLEAVYEGAVAGRAI